MEVLHQVLLVGLQRCTVAVGVIAPRGEKAGENLVVRVPHNLANEGKLSFRNLLPYRPNVAEARPNGIIRDVFINYLCNCDAQYLSNATVKERFQLFNIVSRSAQLSHPHSARLRGMAQKIRYLRWTSTALSTQKCWRKPIADEAWDRRWSISKSSQRE